MANINAPFGFRPVSQTAGGSHRTGSYTIASGYGTAIFEGDPVELTGTADNIQRAAGGNADNLGIFAGVEFTDANGDRKYQPYWPASQVATDIVAFVYDDPFTEFEVQTDTLAAVDVGLLADWTFGVAGNTMYGRSGASLVASGGATSGQSFRIKKLANSPSRTDNAYGAYAVAVVQWAEHIRLQAAGV